MKQQGAARAGDIERAVRDALLRSQVLRPGGTLVVATSGGADSLCLLHVLHRISAEFGQSLHVAHLDHMLRGGESMADARFVHALAESLGLPCTVESRDAAAFRDAHRCSLEEAAREVRYAFLLDVARAAGAAAVATGHTRDDAVETVMLHILRGTGVHGLRGLEPVSRFPQSAGDAAGETPPLLLRPLLEVSRSETMDYCRSLGLMPREDSSNLAMAHLRNRIRLELLPSLRQLNPRVDDALLRLAGIAAEDDDCISSTAHELWERGAVVSEDAVTFPLDLFLASPPAVQSRLVLETMTRLSGSARDVALGHVEAVRDIASGPTGKRVDLPGGVTWRRERSSLRAFLRKTEERELRATMPESPLELAVPGEVPVPGGRIAASLGESVHCAETSPYVAQLDAALTGDRLLVRRRRPGDRFRPLGMAGEKKLQDLMVDAHIPVDERDGIPIVCSTSHIVWVAGWRIDDRVKTTASTQRVLRLEFVRER